MYGTSCNGELCTFGSSTVQSSLLDSVNVSQVVFTQIAMNIAVNEVCIVVNILYCGSVYICLYIFDIYVCSYKYSLYCCC